MNAKKREADLYEKEQHEEALRRAQHRALALETQSDALSDNLEESRREIRKVAKDVGEGKRKKRRDGKSTDGIKRAFNDATTNVLVHVSRRNIGVSSTQKKGARID